MSANVYITTPNTFTEKRNEIITINTKNKIITLVASKDTKIPKLNMIEIPTSMQFRIEEGFAGLLTIDNQLTGLGLVSMNGLDVIYPGDNNEISFPVINFNEDLIVAKGQVVGHLMVIKPEMINKKYNQ